MKRVNPWLLGLVLMTVLACGGGGVGGPDLPALPPVVQNAGFESPVLAPSGFSNFVFLSGTAWIGSNTASGNGIANGSGSWGTGGHSGNQYAFLQNTAVFRQPISGFRPGRMYRVTFWWSRRNGHVGGNDPNTIEVLLGTTSVFGPATTPNDSIWRQVTSATFTATETSYDLVFQGSNTIGDRSSLIDDVDIELLP